MSHKNKIIRQNNKDLKDHLEHYLYDFGLWKDLLKFKETLYREMLINGTVTKVKTLFDKCK